MSEKLSVGVEKRWEYTTLEAESPMTAPGLVETLDFMGADGWELVTFNYGCMIFKREVTPKMADYREQKARDDQQGRYVAHLHMAHHHFVNRYSSDAVTEHRRLYTDCDFGILEETS